MIIALKWLWMTLNWPQMYVFWKYTQSNADSRFLMHNNKKSIEIDCLFGMIRVLRVFFAWEILFEITVISSKKVALKIWNYHLFFMTLLSVTFSVFFMTKILLSFWGWQERENLSISKREKLLLISKWKA